MTNKGRTPRLRQQIDDNLRRVYSDAVKEPLPDRFVQLLDRLRAKESDEPEGPQDNSDQSSKDGS